jgi:hypothetical protein
MVHQTGTDLGAIQREKSRIRERRPRRNAATELPHDLGWRLQQGAERPRPFTTCRPARPCWPEDSAHGPTAQHPFVVVLVDVVA